VVFSLMAGVLPLALLGSYLLSINRLLPGAATGDPEPVLVGFHTTFNVIGALLVLPFSGPFAALITRLVPERLSPFSRRLDKNLLTDPSLAVGAANTALDDLAVKSFHELARLLEGKPPASREGHLDPVALAVAETRSYSIVRSIACAGTRVGQCRRTTDSGAGGATSRVRWRGDRPKPCAPFGSFSRNARRYSGARPSSSAPAASPTRKQPAPRDQAAAGI